MRQFGHKFLIGIGFSAADLVVDVDRGKHHSQLFLQFQQEPQQSHRINAARNRHADSVPGAQQRLFVNVSANALGEVLHGYIVSQKGD